MVANPAKTSVPQASGPCRSAGRARRLWETPVQHNATNCYTFRGFRPLLQRWEAPPPPGTAAGVTQCNELQHISGILAPTAAPNGYDRLASGRDRAWDRWNPGDPAEPLPKDLPI